jgi:HEPN domain-containing protein
LRHKDIAEAFLIEARSDLNSARLLLEGGEHSQSIAHSQHAVEKTLKAALALRDIIITSQHVVSADFVTAYHIAASLERVGLKTEYPFFGRADLPIWIPSQQYKQEDAREALSKARDVFRSVMEFLKANYEVSF